MNIEAPQAEATIPFTSIYNLLTNFHQTHNTLDLPVSHPTTLKILDILTALNLETIVNKRWDENHTKLRHYKRKFGDVENINESTGNAVDDCEITDLKEWMGLMRGCCRDYERYWQGYNARHGSMRSNGAQDGAGLSVDASNQSHQTIISTERYLKLKNIGLTSNKWEKRLVELREFREEHGHCDVPINYVGGLGIWVATQRETYNFEKETMPLERIQALDSLGFSWGRWGRQRSKARKDAWDKMFNELIEYKNIHGHCNISQYEETNKQLGKWAKNQRYEYRRYHNKGLGQSRISRDRIDKLESIGFLWRLKPEKVSWDERFEMLKRYKEEHGHCRPPQNHPEIGSWAKYQRNQLHYFLEGKSSKVDQEKVNKLLAIGFNDPPPSRLEQESLLDNPDASEAQQKRARRRMARMKRSAEHQTDSHHMQALNHEQYPPQYEFDPNASLEAYYQQCEHGTSIPDAGSQYQYDQYHYQSGI